MSWKNRIISGLLALVLTFGLGVWVGWDKIPQPTYPDPQKYFQTIHTPREDGSNAYTAWAEKRCRQSARVAIYTLNDPAVVDVWVKLKTEYHSDVKVLLDLTESRAVSTEKEAIAKLDAAHIEYRIGHSPKRSAIMHNKFTACDGAWVEDGSWNYTTSANYQANTLNFNTVPSPMRYKNFLEEWDYLWEDFGRQEQRRNSR
jgi:PLD-like domain